MAGTSYTRQSTITDGDLITASIFNNEYNQILNAFAYATSSTTGHQHDGSAGQGGNIAKIGDQDFKNKVVISAANNRIEFYSEVSNSPVEQVRIQDGLITPVTDSDVDLGTTSVRFKDAFVDSVTITNNIVVGGTVDGRDVATDGTKLDGIEASATADQTDAQIRAAVEAATDSNVFTDADHTKLNAIEASATADQTDAEIRAAVEAATDSNVFTDADHTKLNAIEASADVTDTANVTASGALMDSEVTNLAQVKAFASSDYATAAQGTLAAAALPKAGGAMTGAITTNSTFDGRDVATDGTKLDGIEASATADQTDAEIRAAVEAATDSNVFTDADHTKLNAIEASADVTDATNVTAAGALMDSEVTNLAQVKAFASSDYATAAQGTLAAAALPKSGGAMTGAITTNSTFDGVDIATRDGVLSSTTTTANAALPKAGGTMSGAIAMGTSKITGAGDPTAAQDVATKAYVDANAGGDGGGETLQQTLAIGNTVTTDTKIQFRDTGLYINSSADGQLDIVADTEIQIAATTVDLNGVLDVSGNIVVAGTVDGVDIATRDGVLSSTTTTAGAALPKSGGAMTGAITTNSTFDGVDIATRDGVLTTTTNTANAALPKSGGAMTGAIAMGTSKITGAGNPTADQDVATKAYVDTEVAGVVDSAPAALNTLNELAAALGDDANFSTTVTNSIAAKLPKAGGTMTGAIAMGTSKITGMGDPTAAQDAATKAYVDSQSGGGETLAETLALGNRTAAAGKIEFRDGAIYINSSVDGQLDIVADGEVQLAATTFDINAAVVTNGDVTVGDDLSLLSDGSKINFGLNSDVSLTHQHNLGLLLNGTRRLYFNDTSQYIYGSDTTRLKMGATNEIELNATLIDVNGALDVSGNIVVAGTVDGRDVAADGVTADAALPKAGGTMTGALTSGSDGTGHDVKFFGDTSGHYMLYDASTDNLNLVGSGSSLVVGGSILTQTTGNFTEQGGSNFLAAITEDSDTLSGSGAVTINLNNATNWLHDLSGNTTYTFTYPTTSNAQVSSSFTLKIIQGTTARTITWPSSVDWAGGTAPTLSTANNAVDVFVFYTIDSGTTWYGFTAGQAMA